MYTQDSILCQFGPRNLSSVQQLISQPILIHFWWELYHGDPEGSLPEHKTPTVLIRSRDEENPSGSKPMATFDPSDLIGRTSLLPPEENGERHRAKVTRKIVEIIDQEDGQRVENINFILDIGNGEVEELISYNQLLEHLENAQDHDMGMDKELYKFRAIIGHQGPLLASDPDWKGSKYNVQVEWETGEITFEPLSIIAADDLVTCLEGSGALPRRTKSLQEPLSKVRLGKSGDLKLTCLGTSSPESTWKPCNLTQKTKTANGMMP